MKAIIEGIEIKGTPQEIKEFIQQKKEPSRRGPKKGIDKTKAIRIYGPYMKNGKAFWTVYPGNESTKKWVDDKKEILRFIPDTK
jgi:hypothetical protein